MIEPQLLASLLGDPEQLQDRLSAMIAERSGTDERFGALAQMFAPSPEPQTDPAPSARQVALDRIKLRITQMRDELAASSKRDGMLATALGACNACFGLDPDCSHCRGAGSAGWLAPDPLLFQQLISPAIARLTHDIEAQVARKGTGA